MKYKIYQWGIIAIGFYKLEIMWASSSYDDGDFSQASVSSAREIGRLRCTSAADVAEMMQIHNFLSVITFAGLLLTMSALGGNGLSFLSIRNLCFYYDLPLLVPNVCSKEKQCFSYVKISM